MRTTPPLRIWWRIIAPPPPQPRWWPFFPNGGRRYGPSSSARRHLRQLLALRLEAIRHRLERLRQRMGELHPSHWLERKRGWLLQQRKLLTALSPLHLLERGFSILQDGEGNLVRSVTDLRPDDAIAIQIMDGQVLATVNQIQPRKPCPLTSQALKVRELE